MSTRRSKGGQQKQNSRSGKKNTDKLPAKTRKSRNSQSNHSIPKKGKARMKNFPEDQVRHIARTMGQEFKAQLEKEHGTPEELERIFREELSTVLPEYFPPPSAPLPTPATPPATAAAASPPATP